MHWLLLFGAIAAVVVAFTTTSMTTLVVSLLAAVVLSFSWVFIQLSRRLDDRRRDDMLIIDPRELQRLRERAAAQRAADAAERSSEPPAP